jgi:hypothetical protein
LSERGFYGRKGAFCSWKGDADGADITDRLRKESDFQLQATRPLSLRLDRSEVERTTKYDLPGPESTSADRRTLHTCRVSSLPGIDWLEKETRPLTEDVPP